MITIYFHSMNSSLFTMREHIAVLSLFAQEQGSTTKHVVEKFGLTYPVVKYRGGFKIPQD